ncbi:MAG TPA: FadR/GntR family transcriptional regulator [Actinomycetota bacterium]|nr:FadR/GntR family transcriptional regulator [Actinomycetota bacterium]HEV3495650.1 FadR/GntR family transcriptional regulator [Actinomycetes bacterium]
MPPKVTAVLDDVFFRNAHWHSAYEVAVQRLAQAIKLGALSVGAQLPPERELVERLAVSRTTLREAVRALQQQGYLKTSRGRLGGTFVASRQIRQLSRAEVTRITRELGPTLQDLIDLRASVEPSAAELAASRASDDEVEVLRWLLERSQQATVPDLRQADSTLHIAIAHAANSNRLLDLVLEEQMRLHDILAYLPFARENGDPVKRSTGQHAKIVDAIARRDGEAARKAMAEHIAGTNDIIFGLLQRRSSSRSPT